MKMLFLFQDLQALMLCPLQISLSIQENPVNDQEAILLGSLKRWECVALLRPYCLPAQLLI